MDDLEFSQVIFETPYAFILNTFLVLVATVSCTGHMPVIDTNTLSVVRYVCKTRTKIILCFM